MFQDFSFLPAEEQFSPHGIFIFSKKWEGPVSFNLLLGEIYLFSNSLAISTEGFLQTRKSVTAWRRVCVHKNFNVYII